VSFQPQVYLTQNDEIAAETFSWGDLKWLCNGRLLPGAGQTLGLCHILAGQANPPHYHPNCEELLYMLSGTGQHRLGDNWIAVRPGSTVRIPLGMPHQLVNDGAESITCLVAFSSGDRQTIFIDA